MKYRPLGDTVLIELDEVVEERSEGGIILAHKQSKEIRQKGKESGTVLALGNLLSPKDTGYNVGDRVCFKRYSGTYLEDENSNLRLLSDADILAVMESN